MCFSVINTASTLEVCIFHKCELHQFQMQETEDTFDDTETKYLRWKEILILYFT